MCTTDIAVQNDIGNENRCLRGRDRFADETKKRARPNRFEFAPSRRKLERNSCVNV